MEIVGASLLLAAAGTWIGSIIFQTAVVAPTVFASLDESSARVFLRRLFPSFFRLGLVCGGLMLLGLALTGFDSRLARLIGAATGVMLVLEAASLWMVPTINAARDSDDHQRFERLHRINVALTVVVLLLGIAILTLIATSRPFG